MDIPKKLSESIIRNLNRIRDRTFEDENIRLFLIDIRQYCRHRIELYEVANFLAHPDKRDRGISLEFIDRFYIQLQVAFNVISLDKINKKVYEVMLSTVAESDSLRVQMVTGMTSNEGIAFIKTAYAQTDAIFQLQNLAEALTLEKLFIAAMTSKVPKPALTQDNLIADLFLTVREISKKLNIEDVYSAKILEYSDEILLCFYCNLHDMRLKLYDGQLVSGHLSVRTVGGPDAIPKEQLTLHLDSTFQLTDGQIQEFQFAVSKVTVYSYCSDEAKETFAFGYVDPFPCYVAKRKSGNLQLFYS